MPLSLTTLLTVRLIAATPALIVVDTADMTILADGSVWHNGELVAPGRRLQGILKLRVQLLRIHARRAGVSETELCALAGLTVGDDDVPSDTPAYCTDCGARVPCGCPRWRR